MHCVLGCHVEDLPLRVDPLLVDYHEYQIKGAFILGRVNKVTKVQKLILFIIGIIKSSSGVINRRRKIIIWQKGTNNDWEELSKWPHGFFLDWYLDRLLRLFHGDPALYGPVMQSSYREAECTNGIFSYMISKPVQMLSSALKKGTQINYTPQPVKPQKLELAANLNGENPANLIDEGQLS
ncbi:unnamed protein product [Ilex paraguariensis]|uniref:Uncharacterized protein n=1 Tax=Ilex paraguariensis TaxID=185542 RepID=A0ABC8RFF9_9AQUA